MGHNGLRHSCKTGQYGTDMETMFDQELLPARLSDNEEPPTAARPAPEATQHPIYSFRQRLSPRASLTSQVLLEPESQAGSDHHLRRSDRQREAFSY